MTHDEDAITGLTAGSDADDRAMPVAAEAVHDCDVAEDTRPRHKPDTAATPATETGPCTGVERISAAGTADREDPTQASDAALLALIAEDASRAAFVVLFDRYAGRVKGFLMAAGATHEEAEEGVQEVMVSLWRQARQFNAARGGASTWIYTIARNKRIDLIRRQRRPAPDPEDPLFAPDPIRGAEHEVAHEQRDSRVRKALAVLSEDQLAVVRLTFFAGLTQTEIAEQLGTPLGTVKSRLRLSFQRLREALGDDFQGELLDE